ncbi:MULTISPECIES: hypothetical protein [unclassified Streptomyces]|uniref:hypothetical protein n=1 Tax=unclassified Streptomyces TaxID=2593676 RepID=UPI002035C57E|nr:MULTISPECIES: hypothetical protein [unclassified Streptomyces]
MRERDDTADRPGEGGLTTENLAHPEKEKEGEPAVYPGDATAGWDEAEDARGDVPDEAGEEARTEEARTEDARTEAPDQAPNEPSDEPQRGRGEPDEPLLAGEQSEGFRQEWGEIQGRFVDDPQDAVRSADTLVAEVMQSLAQTFSAHKQELEGQWGRGEEVATEDLRLALQRYRSFFNRLLNT